MAQMQWIYLDDSGGRHRIGLYHGDQSGHLVIHCNLRVVQVDFSVKESRTYSFFVEEDLVEVRLHANAQPPFSYEFAVNKTVDTPLNRLRKDLEKRNRRHLWYGVGVLLVFLGLMLLGGRWLTQRKANIGGSAEELALSRQLAYEGIHALARVNIQREGTSRKAVYAFRTTDSTLIQGYFLLPDTGAYFLPTDFALADGHTFTIRYLAKQPEVHRLDFDAPGRDAIADYVQSALRAELAAHPETTPERAMCIIQTTIDQRGWLVLADFIFQSAGPEHNPKHHRDTYARLMRHPELAETLKVRCWDK